MKKLDVKSMFIGFVIGIIGVSIVFVATEKISTSTNEKKAVAVTADEKAASNSEQKDNVTISEGIKSAVINNRKVHFNRKEIDLKKPLVNIEKVVDIYNSKHLDESQHKNASDYIKN